MPKKRTYVALILCLFVLQAFPADIGQLFARYDKAKADRQYVMANDLFREFYRQQLSDTLRVFSPSTPRRTSDAYIFEAMSQWYLRNGRFHESIRMASESARLCTALGDSTYIANNYNTLCVDYQRIGDFRQAIHYGQLCYRYDLASGDRDNISSSLSNLATLTLADNHPLVAERYVQQSIRYQLTCHNDAMLALRYGLASEIYTALHRYPRAISYARQAYRLDWKAGREDKAGKRLAQLAAAYDGKGDLKTAERYYLRAIRLLEKHDVKVSLSITYNQLGALYAKRGETDKAETWLKKALGVATEIDNKMQELKACATLAQVLEKSRPAEAIGYLKQENRLRQVIYQEQSEDQISRFNIEYETQEQREKIALQQVEISRNVTRRLQLHVILLLCFAVIAITVIGLRAQRKRNRYLSELNRMKDRFDSLIAHDLKNPVTAQKHLLDVIVEGFDSIDREQLRDLCTHLKESSSSLLDLLYNLLSWSRLESGRISCHPACVPLTDLTDELQSLYRTHLDRKHLTLLVSVQQDTLLTADRNMTATILRNLVGNAIKFFHTGGVIRLSAAAGDDYWRITVADEGTGMSQEVMDRLFKREVHHSGVGTEGETGTGLGLVICYEMAEMQGGRLTVESEEGKGSAFHLFIKKFLPAADREAEAPTV